ncbi:MAG: hypothetical protein P4M09_26475 [Devosia sp.]|nr:hypothetical protein [Devosia sp.]
MGKLVPFEKRRRAPRAKVDPGGSGEILMFTGVRYQRDTAKLPADGTKPERPNRKRG